MGDTAERTRRTGIAPGSGHENRVAAPAPGDLEIVRGFLSVHDHAGSPARSVAPSPATLSAWLGRSGLIDPAAQVDEADLAWVRKVHTALRAKVLENDGAPRDDASIEVLNDAAQRTGLHLCFGCREESRIHTDSEGAEEAIGRILGAAFLAELDGTWVRLHGCDAPDCASIFYDRTKNHSARWCSMDSCGNRNKVRRYRERRAASGSTG
jgi:CGNR zinc finger protein/putative stress-induced transcription regulator